MSGLNPLGAATGILVVLLAGPAGAFPIRTRDPGTGIFSGSAVVGRVVFNEASGAGAEVSTLMVPAAVLYSPTTNSAVGIELPYVERRLSTAEGNDTTRGAGDLMLLGRYKFLSRPAAGRWDQASAQLGLSIPTGATDRQLGLTVPEPTRRALQPGTGTTDLIFDVAGGRFTTRYNIAGNVSYRWRNGGGSVQLGDEFTASTDGELFLFPRWTRARGFELLTLLELSYVHRERTDFNGRAVGDSGGDELLVAPGLQWIATERFLLEVSVQLPVSRSALPPETSLHLPGGPSKRVPAACSGVLHSVTPVGSVSTVAMCGRGSPAARCARCWWRRSAHRRDQPARRAACWCGRSPA